MATARLTFRSGARVCAIYGGADAIPQLRKFAGGIEIVVCRLVGWTDRWLVCWLVWWLKLPSLTGGLRFGWVENGGVVGGWFWVVKG